MIKRLLLMTTLTFTLSGCFMAPIAFIGPVTSGFSTASIIQSTITTSTNYMVKKNTGKTITEHALDKIYGKTVIQQSFMPQESNISSPPNLLVK